MKRRNLIKASAAILTAAPIARFNIARATGTQDPNRLKQDLTPFGAERGASASGYVPEWTGGVTEPPPGWSTGMLPADLFPDEVPVFIVTQANMAQYANLLSDGQKAMLTQYGSAGWQMKVYKTHRTQAYPQANYDNMFENVTRVQPVPQGFVNGFTGAYGGTPFPILDPDPAIAGAQAMWNHGSRWLGAFFHCTNTAYVVGNGQTILTAEQDYFGHYQFYTPGVTAQQIDSGYFQEFYLYYTAPANQLGAKFQTAYSFQPLRYPNTAYEYLVGEGRIREAPQAQYDIPISVDADAINYDEGGGFLGALDRYTWKLAGKKEMIIAYNNHALMAAGPGVVFGDQFVDADKTRWEIHRCWVVEATLAPGKRMTEPFRRFYIDEDCWVIAMNDAYDEQNNLWKFNINYFSYDPSMPGVRGADQNVVYNLQSRQYVANWVDWTKFNGGISYDPVPVSTFSPQNMANSGGL